MSAWSWSVRRGRTWVLALAVQSVCFPPSHPERVLIHALCLTHHTTLPLRQTSCCGEHTHTHFSFALIFTNIFLRVWYFRSCSDWDCLPILDISRLPIVEEFASMKITLKTLQQDTFHVEIDDTENVRVCARVLRSNFWPVATYLDYFTCLFLLILGSCTEGEYRKGQGCWL